MEKPKKSTKYGPVTGSSDYPDDVDVKRVKLKISRKELEQMSKDEVLAFIKSERKKYKKARKEKKKEIRRKKREQRRNEGGFSLPFEIHVGSVAFSILIATVILAGSILLLRMADSTDTTDNGAGYIDERSFSLASTPWEDHQITQSALFAGISGLWENRQYTESIADIDELINEAADDESLVKELELLKLHAIARSEDYNRAIHYSRTLQSNYGGDADFMAEVYWYRGHIFYQTGRPYDAFRAFQSVGRHQGARAEEAWELVDYLNDNYL